MNGTINMKKIRLITNCERPVNYLMKIAVDYWLKTFNASEIIFLVNNITNFDMVADLKHNFNIDATRVHSIDEAANTDGCLVWDYLKCNDYDRYHDLDAIIVNDLQKKLLDNGTDVVIFLDRDELLYHENLRDVLNSFDEDVIRPRGIEIIQNSNELALDITKPLNEQRSYVRYYASKSKPCITKISIEWSIGRHLTACETYPHGDDAGPSAEYPGLYLIHLDKIDKDLLYNLRLESNNIFVNNRYHVGVIDREKYLQWFYESHTNNELYEDKTFLQKIQI
jgi:hypothetical protein